MNFSFTLQELSVLLGEGVAVQGRVSDAISGIASLDEAGAGDLTFLINPKLRSRVAHTQASVVLLPKDYEGEPQQEQAFLRVAEPADAFIRLCHHIEHINFPSPEPGIHPSAVVDVSASIAQDAFVGPLCVIEAGVTVGAGSRLDAQVFLGRGVKVGRHCRLMPQVVMTAQCILGDRVQLNPGCIIGAEGYGYTSSSEGHQKEPQIGRVVIENDVEIGANSTIDRARFSETRIGEGTKIDNLVQIAHNVQVGRHCLLAAQSGVAGSTVLEDAVVAGGQVGIGGHIRIAQGNQLGRRAAVYRSLPKGSVPMGGNPAVPITKANRIFLLQQRLPELFKRVARMEELLESSVEE